MSKPRIHRSWSTDKDLISFNVVVRETDIQITAGENVKREALILAKKYREDIERYIQKDKNFLLSMVPVKPKVERCPDIIREMIKKSTAVGVGPMATVSGAIAEYVGKGLLRYSSEMIVEVGGDIFIKSTKPRQVGIFSGKGSRFNQMIGFEIDPDRTPMGICTSSGTTGHSISFGKSDAVVVVSPSAVLADAAATHIGNHVKEKGDIQKGFEIAKTIKRIIGVVIAIDESIGSWGDIKLVKTF